MIAVLLLSLFILLFIFLSAACCGVSHNERPLDLIRAQILSDGFIGLGLSELFPKSSGKRLLLNYLPGPTEAPFTVVKLNMAETRKIDLAGNNDMTQTEPGKPRSFGWEELCKKPQWLVCVGGSTEGGPVAASSWCGGWRFGGSVDLFLVV